MMGKGWKTFKVHSRKSLCHCEWTVRKNSSEHSERKEESYREILNLFREYLSSPEQNFYGNMGGKVHLMRPEIEMRNMLLDSGGIAILL